MGLPPLPLDIANGVLPVASESSIAFAYAAAFTWPLPVHIVRSFPSSALGNL
jgi:hypothetical protein